MGQIPLPQNAFLQLFARTEQKNGVQSFGYNSAESESIELMPGIMWAKCWGWPFWALSAQ